MCPSKDSSAEQHRAFIRSVALQLHAGMPVLPCNLPLLYAPFGIDSVEAAVG